MARGPCLPGRAHWTMTRLQQVRQHRCCATDTFEKVDSTSDLRWLAAASLTQSVAKSSESTHHARLHCICTHYAADVPSWWG
jgi:hypothetical protein